VKNDKQHSLTHHLATEQREHWAQRQQCLSRSPTF